ncbi:MAG: hypothetical protein JNM72_24655 [Deltaproteobacteria bacterium]|nr:hypothetical protein [Deltaproteobacteria bacterium]
MLLTLAEIADQLGRLDEEAVRSAVGGKALGLAALHRAGLPVPAAVVLPAAALRAAAREAGVDQLEGDALEAALAQQALPPALEEALLTLGPGLGRRLAVRSSATDEDGAQRSHAGQLETVLGVAPGPAVLAAVRRCWASAHAPRARAYRGGPAGLVDVAVVIQELVEPRCAGVLFTINPASGAWREMTVEAAWGLGEAVVSGQVVPEWSRIHRPPPLPGAAGRLAARARLRVLERHLHPQARLLALGPNGVEEQAVPPQRVDAEKLDEQTLLRLCRLGLAAERARGGPQDVEWAQREDGALVLLQARPVSTARDVRPAGAVVWTRRFLGERWTEPATPLGWSVISEQLEWFIAYPRVSRRHLGGAPALRLHRFAPYVNATIFRHLSFKLPGMSPPRFLLELLPADEEAAWLRGIARAPDLAVYGAVVQDTLRERRWRRFRWNPLRNWADWDSFADALAAELPALHAPIHDESDALRRHHRCVELLRAYISIHICSLLFANITYEAAAAVLSASGREGLTARVLRPRAESWTVRTNRALRALGRGEMALDAFLDEFGHRASSSWELFSPRWAEAPEIALSLAAAARGAPDPSVEAAQARLEADRAALRLPDGLRGLVELARRYLQLREDQRFVFDRLAWAHKKALLWLEGARGLQLRFLEHGELVGLVEGRLDPAAARGLISRRAEAWAAEVERRRVGDEPPMVLTEGEEEAPRVAEGRLTGLGISAGEVRAVARVLRSPAEGARLARGEVLVARAADPGWTPLFLVAGGVVLEQGGMLSHGAVVAREYGLPGVVNVEGATSRIADGQVITVDGRRGLVFLG